MSIILTMAIADQMRSENFRNFDAFRERFWELMGNDPIMQNRFEFANDAATSRNKYRMRAKAAPMVAGITMNGARQYPQGVGKMRKYILHHMKPIWNGGGVYDLDNIVIVTPRFHQEILGADYHFRKGEYQEYDYGGGEIL